MEFDGNHRLQPNRRVARLSALELVALPLSRRTSAAVVCRILPLPPSAGAGGATAASPAKNRRKLLSRHTV